MSAKLIDGKKIALEIEFELIEPKKRKIVKKSYADNFLK